MTAFWYEIKFNLLRQYRYKLSFFTTLVSNLILFAGMTAAKSNQPVNGSDAAYAITFSMITYLFWNFGSSLISSNMSNISGDLMSGIFESKLLSNWTLYGCSLPGCCPAGAVYRFSTDCLCCIRAAWYHFPLIYYRLSCYIMYLPSGIMGYVRFQSVILRTDIKI